MPHPYPVTAALAVLLTLSGCILTPAEPVEVAYPPDFALVFHVKAPVGSPDPIHQPSRYLLGPDRVLRVAVGPESDNPGYRYPPPRAKLTAAQMGRIYELADYVTYNGQVLDPAWPADQVVYHVSLTRLGQTQITTLTPAQSPELVDLLSHLVGLTGR